MNAQRALQRGKAASKTSKKRVKRAKNVRQDIRDLRDRLYDPALIPLAQKIDPPTGLIRILDQGTEGACTGFGLAAVINLLNTRQGRKNVSVSPHMLYEMAKLHDEWPGQNYEGSSLRGALRGWFNNGVCSDALWKEPYREGDPFLTLDRARDARNNALGAYYRLRPIVSDFHAALNEAGVIYVSATVHSGWDEVKKADPVIERKRTGLGGHAFAVVGYDGRGFWVQNSWGKHWGRNGLALWTYEDWNENLMDAWVVQLGLPTPQIFNVRASAADRSVSREKSRGTPPRAEIVGHFVHIDDGKFAEKGRYWSREESVRDTAALIARQKDLYRHLVVYAHGGLNSPDDAAVRIRATTDGFKRNGIYPFHVMYGTGLCEELGDILKRSMGLMDERAGGLFDLSDSVLEAMLRKPVTPLWDEMKNDAKLAFADTGAGTRTIALFAEALAGTGQKIHLVGHSTGAVLIGHLLAALDKTFKDAATKPVIESCTLFAPACRVNFFKDFYRSRLGPKASAATKIRQMAIYNLTDKLERDDNVAEIYRKSLLYLVSNALEREDEAPLLGMEKFNKKSNKKFNKEFDAVPGLTFYYAGEDPEHSTSESHGGFDNDDTTMNDMLRIVLGKKPPRPFTKEELDY